MNSVFSRRSMLRAAGAVGLATAGGLVTRGNAFADAVAAPRMTVVRNKPGTMAGEILLAWMGLSDVPNGLQIADTAGTPRWTSLSTSNVFVDFQRQVYRGRDVLTWFQEPAESGGIGGREQQAAWVLTELDHTPITTVEASGDFTPDRHEQRIISANTALINSYSTVPADLSAIGGPVNGRIGDSYVNEVDIASGTVLRRWSALDHVPLSDSYAPIPTSSEQLYDYFHINSISLTPDNHLLVSAANTSALYKVHRTTGEIIWCLGGKSSSFSVAPDAVFAFQHHAVFEGPRTIRLFDNGGSDSTTLHPSRVVWLHIDEACRTASLLDSMSIPGNAQSSAMGSAQRLPNGNVFVSWGSNPRLSEFSPRGHLLFDAVLPGPCYRAFKYRGR
jgi:hypothetical protein